MAFQIVNASGRQGSRGRASTNPEVSFYGKTSQFRVNGPAMVLLGNPEKLEAHFDAENRRIALVPSTAAYAVTLRADAKGQSENTSRYFGFRALANLAGLDANTRWTLPLTLDEDSGFYIIDLNAIPADAVTPPPTPRKSRKAAAAAVAATNPDEAVSAADASDNASEIDTAEQTAA